jgi:hypothetical protein
MPFGVCTLPRAQRLTRLGELQQRLIAPSHFVEHLYDVPEWRKLLPLLHDRCVELAESTIQLQPTERDDRLHRDGAFIAYNRRTGYPAFSDHTPLPIRMGEREYPSARAAFEALVVRRFEGEEGLARVLDERASHPEESVTSTTTSRTRRLSSVMNPGTCV